MAPHFECEIQKNSGLKNYEKINFMAMLIPCRSANIISFKPSELCVIIFKMQAFLGCPQTL